MKPATQNSTLMTEISYPVTPQSAGFAETPLPFSLATRVGNLLFVSGQASVDENGAIMPGTFEAEMPGSMENLRRVLLAAGSDFNRVAQVRAEVEPIKISESNSP